MEKQLLNGMKHPPEPPSNGQMPGSLELAFLGDTVYDLYVRGRVVSSGGKMKALHNASTAMVRASAQSLALGRIEPMLFEEEQDVVRRARNAKQSPPKNADPKDYHRATSIEALIGYLYMMGRIERLDELMNTALGEQ